jgi:hypothetical protein
MNSNEKVSYRILLTEKDNFCERRLKQKKKNIAEFLPDFTQSGKTVLSHIEGPPKKELECG